MQSSGAPTMTSDPDRLCVISQIVNPCAAGSPHKVEVT
jgi:hypothetical protein